jgi:solute carrier family 25 (mitochondrial uncoupling protein), member 27
MREDVLRREADGTFPLWKAVVGGMTSGALAQFFSSPTDVIKVRMQTEYGRLRAGLPPLYKCVARWFGLWGLCVGLLGWGWG